MSDSALHAVRRERELAESTDGRVVDLLVVGLGVTGAGVALDAATRGLDVVAVDAHDLAFGTSRWSSKLVHGGLRYLARGQVAVAHESAVERGILMTRTAPHLTRTLPMLMPLGARVSHGQALLGYAGLEAGDLLRRSARTPKAVLPRPRRLDRAETLARVPGLRQGGLRGGLLGFDGQLEDDVRLVVALARTAAGAGARVVTRARVEALSGDGALVRDMLTGTTHSIKARSVVNATGVWAGGLVPGVSLRPSRGTHLVLAKDTLPIRDAVLAPVPHEHNRFVFALPQSDGRVYVGITDEPVDGPLPEIPEPTPGEIGFLLDVIGAAFERPITRADVAGAYAGLRPLLDAHGRTSDLSRRHAVLTSPEGVVTVVGGKLTTYRRMAEDAVDAAVKRRGLEAGPCRTGNLPVVGAATIRLCCASEKGTNLDRRIVSRFGDEAGEVVAHAVELTGLSEAEVLEPIAAGVTRAELVWGVTHEVALDVDDLLDRRTRVGLVDAERRLVEPAARDALSLSARGR